MNKRITMIAVLITAGVLCFVRYIEAQSESPDCDDTISVPCNPATSPTYIRCANGNYWSQYETAGNVNIDSCDSYALGPGYCTYEDTVLCGYSVVTTGCDGITISQWTTENIVEYGCKF